MDYRLKYALIEQIICGFERTNTLYIDYSEVMVVPKAGFEPARVTPHAPQTCVSTRFHHFGMEDLCYYKNPEVFKLPCYQAISCLLILIFTCFLRPSIYDFTTFSFLSLSICSLSISATCLSPVIFAKSESMSDKLIDN